jgi:hypothetical protein
VEVRVGDEHPLHPGEVLGRAADVGADEGGSRRRRHHRLEGGQQPVERRLAGSSGPPAGVLQQLLEPLVVPVKGLEEGERVGGVDDHRQAQLAGRHEHLGQPGIVGQHPPAAGVLDGQAQVLPDLDPTGAGRPGRLQAPDQRRGRVGPAQGRPVQVTVGGEAAGMGAVVAVEVGLQLLAPAAVQVDDRGHADLVHQVEQGRDVGRGPAAVRVQPSPQVVVGVDGGQRRLGHRGGRMSERRDRRVVTQGQAGQGGQVRRGDAILHERAS